MDYYWRQPFTDKYPKRSRRWYVITIKKNANKTDHLIGRLWDRCCWRRLHSMEQDNFLTINWFIWFRKAAVKQESKTAWITRKLSVIYEQSRENTGGIPIRPEMRATSLFLMTGKSIPFKGDFHGILEFLRSELILGRKKNAKARQAVFFTPLDPFGNNPDEKKKNSWWLITLFLRRCIAWLIGNTIKMLYIG